MKRFQSGKIALEEPIHAFLNWILHISKTHAYLQEKCDKINAQIDLSSSIRDLQNYYMAFLNVNDFKFGKAFFAFENQSIEFAKDSLRSLNVKLLWQNNMNF